MVNVFPKPDSFDRGVAQPLAAQLTTDFMGWFSWHPVTADAGGMGLGKLEVLDDDLAGGSLLAQGAATCYGSSHSYQGKGHGFVRREHFAESSPSTTKICVTAGLRVRDVAVLPAEFTAADIMKGRLGVMLRVREGTIVNPTGATTDPELVLQDSFAYAAFFTQSATAGKLDVELRQYGPTGYNTLATTTIEPQGQDFLITTDVRLCAWLSGTDVQLTLEWRNAAGASHQGGTVGGAGVPLGPSPRIGSGGPGAQGSFTTGGAVPTVLKPKIGRDWTLLLSHLDNSGTKITLPGRAGIMLGKEDQVGFAFPPVAHIAQTVYTCDYFQVSSISVATDAETVLLRDEFRRSSRQGIELLTSSLDNRWGQTGVNIQSDVTYDRASEVYVQTQAFPYIGGPEAVGLNGFMGHEAEVLTSGAGGLQVTQPVSTQAQDQFLIYLLAADLDGFAHRFRAGFRHQAVGASYAGVKAGLALRADVAGPAGQIGALVGYWHGYVFSIGGDGLCEITRHQYAIQDFDAIPESDTVVLASATIAHSTTSRTIEAEVYEEEGTSAPGTGPATLIMKVDGVQVPLVANSAADGVSVDGSGTVRDAGSYLIQGPQNSVALWCAFPTTDGATTHTIELESIEQLSGSTVDPPDSDLASIVLNSETTGKTGTLVVPLSRCRRTISQPSITGARFVDGRRQKRPATTFMRRSWDCETQPLDPTEFEDFISFWEDHRGIEIPFDWAPVEDASLGAGLVSVKFGAPQLAIVRLNGTTEQRHVVRFSLNEVTA